MYFTELNEPNFLNPHLILLKTSDARLQKVAQDFLRVSDRVKMGIKSNVVSSDSSEKCLIKAKKQTLSYINNYIKNFILCQNYDTTFDIIKEPEREVRICNLDTCE